MNRDMRSMAIAMATIGVLLAGVVAPATRAEDGFATSANASKHGKRRTPRFVEVSDARLKIELNSTALDAGIQVFLDSDPWASMNIFSPHGRLIFRSTVRGSLGKQGGTELFLESAEPELAELPLEQFFERFPEGNYWFFGRGVEGEYLFGTAAFTHNLADGPELVSPLEGTDPVDPDGAVVVWKQVDDPDGGPIIGYQVLVVALESDFPAIPKITLDVMMPASATSLRVPPGFLLPDTEYEWEVLAIEESGNQTLSTSFFRTSPQ